MAYRSVGADAIYSIAVGLLLLGGLRHYGIYLVPLEHRAQAWNAAGALCIVALLLAAVWRVRSRLVQAIIAWWIAEEAMVAGCSMWFIYRPWVVSPSDDQCSALIDFDLGRIGLLAITILILLLPVRVLDD